MKKLEVINKYTEKITFYSEKLKQLQKNNRISSYLRAIIFIALLIVIYNYNNLGSIILTIITSILILAFIFFVKKNLKLKKEIRKHKILIKLNKNEIEVINNNFRIFHNGKEYINYEHPFSYDLDIFGEASLFQYLNRTSTIAGKNKLAENISTICLNKKEIDKKQIAINELSHLIDFRQQFTATALTIDKKFSEKENSTKDISLNKLIDWSNTNTKFINNHIWKYLLIILPLITISLLVLGVLNILPYSFMGLSAMINLGVIGIFIKKINLEHSKLGEITKSLGKISELIKIVENKNFKSKYLQKIQQKLSEQSAYYTISKLNKALHTFDLRLNMIAGVLLNAFILLDLQMVSKLEKQKKSFSDNIEKWFSAIGEFDALISLANFKYNNPTYVFPTISEDDFLLKIKNGGHPLISSNKVITNDFEINSLQFISIITGANMAGKSTFLRTVGINMILALTGSVVCTEEMKVSPIQIFTSVRTNDSLEKNESYFYAELMRLKKITDNLKSGKKLFVVIDEMLRGTNSKDKHKGSYELIKQLIKHKTSGLVATHDIQLGKLIEEYPNNISNKRFEVEIADNEVVFDYKIKDGISQNLNASFLMKKYGIIE